MTEPILVKRPNKNGVAVITFSNPEKRNAFGPPAINALRKALDSLAQDNPACLVIDAQGPHFCAGADLTWMRSMKDSSPEDNIRDARNLSSMLRQIDQFPAPVACLVHGAAYAGATGIVAAADVAVGAPNAQFRLTEVRLGLIPAVISPYLQRAMGIRQTRRYMLSAEIFHAQQALHDGLLHIILHDDNFLQAAHSWVQQNLLHAPLAQKETKRLTHALHPMPDAQQDLAAFTIANARLSNEAREGVDAFFEKRDPKWNAP